MTMTDVHGETKVENGVGTVIVSSVYATDADDLWLAVTSLDRLRRWFGDLTPRADDNATSFDAALTTGWSGRVTVTACEPPARLTAQLSDESTVTTVTATLIPTEGGTRLTIEERGLEPVGLYNYVAGWHAQLDQLDARLKGDDDVPWLARWEQLRDEYRAATEPTD